jgi:exosortase
LLLCSTAGFAPFAVAVAAALADADVAARAAPVLAGPLCALLIATAPRGTPRRGRARAAGAWALALVAAGAAAAGHPLLGGLLLPAWAFLALPAVGLVDRRHVAPPALMLALSFPFAHVAGLGGVTAQLQSATARAAAALARLAGAEARASGIFIDTPRFSGVVTDGCAGLTMLVGLVMTGLAAAHVLRAGTGRTLAVAAACVAAGAAANAVRVAGLTAVGHHLGAAAVDGPLHDVTGVVVFAAAATLTAGLAGGARRRAAVRAEARG